MSSSNPKAVIASLVAATISTVFPGFAAGALSVQLTAEYGVGEATYGWALGAFFLSAAAGSVVLGRTAQSLGPRRQITLALVGSAAAQLTIALFSTEFLALVACMAVLGFLNSGNQTAINLAISQARLPRLGLAIAIKQSGMPAAAMLGGLAVPVIALTVGWEYVFGLGAAFAVAAIGPMRRQLADGAPSPAQQKGELQSSLASLRTLGLASCALAFCAGSLTGWIVGSGVDAGLGAGQAGLVLSLGAALGITVRLLWGFRLDSITWSPLLGAGAMSLVGSAGLAMLVLRSPAVHVVATLLAFGAGWIWPVFSNFGIVRANPNGAGRATGITQMGVYIGVFSGPLLGGWIIETYSYSVFWMVVFAVALFGAALMIRISPEF